MRAFNPRLCCERGRQHGLTVPDAGCACVGEDVVFMPVCERTCLCEECIRKCVGERGVVDAVDVHIVIDLTAYRNRHGPHKELAATYVPLRGLVSDAVTQRGGCAPCFPG